MKKFLKHNAPKKRTYGAELRRCRVCQNTRGHIGKYGLELCRRCFREVAPTIGWRKMS